MDLQPYPTSKVYRTKSSGYFWKPVFKWRSKFFLKIGRFLPSLIDETNHTEKSNLVYKVPCQNCAFVYIGQTKRDLKSRIKEDQ